MSSSSSSSKPHSNSTSSRTIHRIITLGAILFFAGLQFKYHTDLFRSSNDAVNSNNPDAGWSPDDYVSVRERKPKPEKETETEEAKEERRLKRKERRAKAKKKEKHKEKKKPVKQPVLYTASNYTRDFEPLPWTLPKPSPVRNLTSEEFMAIYIKAKRRHNIPLPWEQKDEYADKLVTLPLPIISLNFPKSATLTMKSYFHCGGITSIHTSTQDGRIAVCLMENQLNDRPPMEGCNLHKIRDGPNKRDVVPIDFISDIGLQGPPCYYPAVHDGGLENIVKHYPNATILLVTRNAAKWYHSISKWGSLVVRLKKYCGFHGDPMYSGAHHNVQNSRYWGKLYQKSQLGGGESREDYWVDFYESHTQKIREFAMKHLSLTYVEVELENPRMAEILEGYTRVKRSCVMDCHPGPKWVRENNATSRCHPVGENPALMRKAKEEEEAREGENEEEEEEGSGNEEEVDVEGEGGTNEDADGESEEGDGNDDDDAAWEDVEKANKE